MEHADGRLGKGDGNLAGEAARLSKVESKEIRLG